VVDALEPGEETDPVDPPMETPMETPMDAPEPTVEVDKGNRADEEETP
jgi:hypothetical protein